MFAGHKPISEPETIAMQNAILDRKDKIKIFISFHSFGQYWLTPWFYDNHRIPENYQDLYKAARVAVKAIENVYGTKYEIGPGSELWHEIGGTSCDWAYGVAKIPYSYSVELPDKNYYGFYLPPNRIKPTGEETWAGVKALAFYILDKIS